MISRRAVFLSFSISTVFWGGACLDGNGSGEIFSTSRQPAQFADQIRRLERSSVQVGFGDKTAPDDDVMVRTIEFRDHLSFEPLILNGAFEIEYLPLIERRRSGPWTLELILRDEEDCDHLLVAGRPTALRDPELIGHRRAVAVSEMVHADLSRWQGQRVELVWRLVDRLGATRTQSLPMPTAHVGRLALRRIDEPRKRLPDILLVCSDTHRFDYAVPPGGGSPMPNLQHFSQSSVRFDGAVSTASWTLPSVASVLTGLYPRSHGTGYSVESGPVDTWVSGTEVPPGHFRVQWGEQYHVFSTFPGEIETVAERLVRRGYTTVLVSANSLVRLAGLGQDGMDLFYSVGQARVDRVRQILAEIEPVLVGRQPVFLYVQLIDVHEYQHLDPAEIPPGIREAGEAAVQKYQYRTQVRNIDDFFGGLIDWWDQGKGRDDSLVAFFSDHGEHLRDPGGPNHGHGISMHDVLLHVPLIVRFPASAGIVPVVVDETVSLVDLSATVMDFAGEDVVKEMLPGRSLVHAATSATGDGRTVFADFQLMGDEKSMAQEGSFKLVLNLSRGTTELFDLRLPGPKGEGAKTIDNLDIKRRLEGRFNTYALEAQAASADLEPDHLIDSADVEAQLRALGYTE